VALDFGGFASGVLSVRCRNIGDVGLVRVVGFVRDVGEQRDVGSGECRPRLLLRANSWFPVLTLLARQSILRDIRYA